MRALLLKNHGDWHISKRVVDKTIVEVTKHVDSTEVTSPKKEVKNETQPEVVADDHADDASINPASPRKSRFGALGKAVKGAFRIGKKHDKDCEESLATALSFETSPTNDNVPVHTVTTTSGPFLPPLDDEIPEEEPETEGATKTAEETTATITPPAAPSTTAAESKDMIENLYTDDNDGKKVGMFEACEGCVIL